MEALRHWHYVALGATTLLAAGNVWLLGLILLTWSAIAPTMTNVNMIVGASQAAATVAHVSVHYYEHWHTAAAAGGRVMPPARGGFLVVVVAAWLMVVRPMSPRLAQRLTTCQITNVVNDCVNS